MLRGFYQNYGFQIIEKKDFEIALKFYTDGIDNMFLVKNDYTNDEYLVVYIERHKFNEKLPFLEVGQMEIIENLYESGEYEVLFAVLIEYENSYVFIEADYRSLDKYTKGSMVLELNEKKVYELITTCNKINIQKLKKS
jgi:hypothetical protein